MWLVLIFRQMRLLVVLVVKSERRSNLIFVRVGSINGGSPYILVDGVEQSLQNVNPADIESISVLKDASASAVYGARAAYGVVLVTTKQR